VPRVSNSPNAP